MTERPYVVYSGPYWRHSERFHTWTAALLTYLGHRNEADGSNVINLDRNDYDHLGLTEQEQSELEEYDT